MFFHMSVQLEVSSRISTVYAAHSSQKNKDWQYVPFTIRSLAIANDVYKIAYSRT